MRWGNRGVFEVKKGVGKWGDFREVVTVLRLGRKGCFLLHRVIVCAVMVSEGKEPAPGGWGKAERFFLGVFWSVLRDYWGGWPVVNGYGGSIWGLLGGGWSECR